MEDLKKKTLQLIQSRLEIQEREALLVADRIQKIHRWILDEEKPDKILKEIEAFLKDFSTGMPIVERRSQQKSKQNSYAEKRRMQIDIFSAASDQP